MRSRTSYWFECTVSYEKVQKNGTQKRITEKYVVGALSFTEAEKKITDELSSYVSGELRVKGIVLAQYNEIFFSVSDAEYRWFKVKVKFITIDESNKEKCTNVIYLVQGSGISSAKAYIDDILRGSLSDFDLCGITETKIIDVFTM